MKKIFLTGALIVSIFSFAQLPLNLIPYPVEVKQQTGNYVLKNSITISCNFPKGNNEPFLRYFRDELKKYSIAVRFVQKNEPATIAFKMQRMPTSGKPAYKLTVNKYGVNITSNFTEPAFHAIQTFLQLLPIDPVATKSIPFVQIFDYARFSYRGMHLDAGRHFFPVSFIKRYIDYLAYHKLNTFHWHLTEDQGWRIEIKKYPALTSVGGWRNGTIVGRYPGNGSDNKKYGGFYTQEEIKEVVAYAKARFIEVIPEIEMPGHSSAAIAAYPWLSCFPEKPSLIPSTMISQKSSEEQRNGRIKLVQETWGVFDDVFCAGNDSTFLFLENVIDEVTSLFPSNYFHIGADECPKAHWKICEKCQQRMKDNNLKDEHELQSWFVQRIEKYLNSKGKTLIGWDEILEGGLAPNAVVMSWRGEAGGIEAAKQKHNVIMTPGNPVYFDHSQSENDDSLTIGGYNPIENVYAYEPIPKELLAEEGKYILGAQANLWTEYIDNPKKAEYMLFPRLAALSEILWSPKENRNWENFEQRLVPQFKRYEHWGASYSNAYYDLKAGITPIQTDNSLMLVLKSKVKGNYLMSHFSTVSEDGIPEKSSPVLFNDSTSFVIKESGSFNSWLLNKPDFEKGKVLSYYTQYFYFNKATAKNIYLKNPPSKSYAGDGAFTLVNAVQNKKGLAKSKQFLGFSGTDCEAVIDLGIFQPITSVTLHTFRQESSWIWEPLTFEAFSSVDDQYYSRLGITEIFTETNNGNGTMKLKFDATPTKFVKIFVKNHGKIPEGKPGAGNDAWLFIDEIEIN